MRDGGSAQFQENIGERRAIAACTDRPGRLTEQKIGKGEKGERSVRGIGALIELITEYFRSKTKIVTTSRQCHCIGKIEIVVGRLILVIYCVSKLESSQYLDAGQAFHLRVADTANPHRLSRQR